MEKKLLFTDTMKYCRECGRALPVKYEEEICPACQDRLLFAQVKEYIREHNVTEHDVAEHFQLPLTKVRAWIRDGRIEYREGEKPVIEELHCVSCGKPILGGQFCPKCQRRRDGAKSGSVGTQSMETSRMRFMDKDK